MDKLYIATGKLYDEKPYETQFQAQIVESFVLDKEWVVVLDKTLFFPEEGGQNSDTGVIHVLGQKLFVKHVRWEKMDGVEVLYHFVETDNGEFLKQGTLVEGEIDWQSRYDRMQNHSGEHILSGLIYKMYGFTNVGFHLNDELLTMDFNGVLSVEELETLENKANQIVAENVPVYGKYVSKEELAVLEYRSKKEIEGEVRIVTIEGYDKCACCAPHVNSTGEIGVIKIVKAENWKGGMRLTVLCGMRAYKDYANKHQIVQQLSRSFSTSEDKLMDMVLGLKTQVSELEYKISTLEYQMVLDKLCLNSTQFFDRVSQKSLTKAMDEMMKAYPENLYMVFVGDDEKGYRYVIGSLTQNVAEMAGKLHGKFGAKGGGRGVMVQGMIVAKRSEIEDM